MRSAAPNTVDSNESRIKSTHVRTQQTRLTGVRQVDVYLLTG